MAICLYYRVAITGPWLSLHYTRLQTNCNGIQRCKGYEKKYDEEKHNQEQKGCKQRPSVVRLVAVHDDAFPLFQKTPDLVCDLLELLVAPTTVTCKVDRHIQYLWSCTRDGAV